MKKVFSLVLIVFLSFGCSDKVQQELTEAEKLIRKYLSYVEKGIDGVYLDISDFSLNNHNTLATSISNCCEQQITVSVGTTTIFVSFKVNATTQYTGSFPESDLPPGKVNRVKITTDQNGLKFTVNNKQVAMTCQSNCGSAPGPGTGTKTVLLSTVVSGNAGDKLFRTVNVPAGVKSIEFRTNEELPGHKNSVNIFVKRGSKPTMTQTQSYNLQHNADCASLSINREQDVCTLDVQESGTWYIVFFDYNNFYFESNLVVTTTK
jgi:hypothetical protein